MGAYAVTNPATRKTVRTYPTISGPCLRHAIDRVEWAYRRWVPSTTVDERARLIARVGHLHRSRREELAAIIVQEMGKPIAQALAELDCTADVYEFYANSIERLLNDEQIPLTAGEGYALLKRGPYGPLLGIMPWNYPYYHVARFAGPNLVIGNPILLKHASQCPESAAAIESIFRDAGFPEDAYINIYATNQQVEWVIGDPRVRGVSLTGSERAGSVVAAIAGRNLKKVVLELGGSDPFILLSTDDLDATVQMAVASRTENAGQACNAAKRLIVADDLYEEFVEKLVAAMSAVSAGDPTRMDTVMGPVASELASDRLAEQLESAIKHGAKLEHGGGRRGNVWQPTVLTQVMPDNPAYLQEFFGPVAIVYRVDSEEHAVRLANDTACGLGSYVISTDSEQAIRVAEQIEAGMVFINLVGVGGAEISFSGVRSSGFARELGAVGVEEFVTKKLIRVAAADPSAMRIRTSLQPPQSILRPSHAFPIEGAGGDGEDPGEELDAALAGLS
jgi:succinate-semialdehyde dehydrogenase / glutarate-semialdehyde dehydrogenase